MILSELSQPNRSYWQTILVALGTIIAFATLYQHINWLFSLTIPLEYSSHFYLQELQSWAETGRGYYTKYNPFFFLLGGFARVGVKPLMILNLTTVTGYLMTIAGIAGIAYHFCPVKWWLVLFIASLTSLNSIFLESYSHPRQMIGLGFLLIGVAIHLHCRLKGRIVLQVSLVSASIASHILPTVIALGLLCTAKLPKRALLWFGITILLAINLHFFSASRDLSLLFDLQSRNPASIAFELGTIGVQELKEHRLALGLVAFTACIQLLYCPPIWRAFILPMAFLFLATPIWSWSELGYALRALRSSILLSALYPLSLIGSVDSLSIRRVFILTPLVLYLASFTSQNAPNSRGQVGPIPIANELIKHKSILQAIIPPDAVVIAPHGIQFQVSYYLNRKSHSDLGFDAKSNTSFQIEQQLGQIRCLPLLDSAARIHGGCIKISPHYVLRIPPPNKSTDQ